MTASRPSSF